VKVLLSEGQVHEMKRAHELCSEVSMLVKLTKSFETPLAPEKA
jgi:hypothetical protein